MTVSSRLGPQTKVTQREAGASLATELVNQEVRIHLLDPYLTLQSLFSAPYENGHLEGSGVTQLHCPFSIISSNKHCSRPGSIYFIEV